MYFIGEYEITLDNKGRFLFPTGFKKQLEGDGPTSFQFIMKRGIEKNITLTTSKEWDKTMKELAQLNPYDPEVREFKRKFLSGIIEVNLDSAGRILIPKNLIAYACLTKDLIICSGGKELEIWDSTIYKHQYTDYDPVEFSRLAQKIMGTHKEKQES